MGLRVYVYTHPRWRGMARDDGQGSQGMKFRITMSGTAALVMQSSRLVDPTDNLTKAIKAITSKKTNKTDDDHAEIARLEFLGGLYHDTDLGPYIPGENIQRCLVDAAKITRQGTHVTRGLFISTDVNPIAYKGPRDIDGLWDDETYRLMADVKVQAARTMRCRPRFPSWAL